MSFVFICVAVALAGIPGGVLCDPFADDSGCGPEMVLIPGGVYRMGSSPLAPGYQPAAVPHQVGLDTFAIGRFEVTNREYARFLNEEGNDDDLGLPYIELGDTRGSGIYLGSDGFQPRPGAERLPVTGISWRGALAYCRWLSQRTGHHYSLPTEAQWERAARAGRTGIWPWGDSFDEDEHRLNCHGKHSGPLAAGSYPANAFGVFDLLGNVWEWTLDCFALDFYLYSPVHDPRFLDPMCLAPGIRGGSFQDPPDYCRPGYRVNYWWRGAPSIGFRVARDLVSPASL